MNYSFPLSLTKARVAFVNLFIYIGRSKPERGFKPATSDYYVWVHRLTKETQIIGLGDLRNPAGGTDAMKSVET